VPTPDSPSGSRLDLNAIRESFSRADTQLNLLEAALRRERASTPPAVPAPVPEKYLIVPEPEPEPERHPIVDVTNASAPSRQQPAVPSHGRGLVGLLLVVGALGPTGVTLLRTRGSAVTPAELEATTFNGTIKPGREITLASPVTSTVREMRVRIGEEVNPGQVLIALDRSATQDALEGARLERIAAEQQVAQLQYSLRLLDQSVSVTASGLAEATKHASQAHEQADRIPTRQWRDSKERAQAAYDNALMRLQRIQRLRGQGIVSDQEVDDVETAVRIAHDDLENAQRWETAVQQLQQAEDRQRQLQLQRSQVDLERQRADQLAQLQQARLRAQVAAQRVEAAERQAGESAVRSTVAGIVVDLPVKVGDEVSAGAVLARLATLKELLVEVPVAASMINALRVGQTAAVFLPTIPPQRVNGSVLTINPIPRPNLTHMVEVRFPNGSGAIFSGQPAEVVFQR
jgi:multidrug efflux pump subunit AcrA (membrane-fusion protein)